MAIGPVSLPGLGDANPLRQNTAIRQLSERLEDYAPLADPVFTGDPQAPTPDLADNDTSIATTAYVKGQNYTTKTYVDAADAILTTAVAGKAATVHTHAESDVTGLVADLAAKEPTIAAGTTSQYWRGDKTWQAFPPAKVVNRYYDEYATWTALTAVIPNDDTIPLVSEGTEILSRVVTTTSTTQRVRVRVIGYVTTSGNQTIFALFAGSTNINSGTTYASSLTPVTFVLEAEYLVGSATTTTISFRIGPAAAATLHVNGANGSRLFGGSSKTSMVIDVIEP